MRAVVETLARLKLTDNTLIIITSDNGPVLNDGYSDAAVAKNGDHTPAGPFAGGKYSKLEGGTRVPMITFWPGTIAPGVSDALVSQVDFVATAAALTKQAVPAGSAADSQDALAVILGKSPAGRSQLVVEGTAGLALRSGNWKFIPASKGHARPKVAEHPNHPRLFDLASDPAETQDLAAKNPQKVAELEAALKQLTAGAESAKSADPGE